jgi:TatD DNase family protein
MEYFDQHCHLDDCKFDDDREEIIKAIYDFGVTNLISAGYSLEGSKRALELANKYDFIYATIGLSPNDFGENYKKELEEIEELILENKTNKKMVAVGEIGLDYHYDTNREWQKEVFIKQIELANKYQYPIVIHTRDAIMETIEILKKYPVDKKGVFHCCPFNKDLVREGLKLGYYISVAGPVTFKNSKNASEHIKQIPLEKLLIETDSPYLSPEPFRGTKNTSKNVPIIANRIAEILNIDVSEVSRITYSNAVKLFDL